MNSVSASYRIYKAWQMHHSPIHAKLMLGIAGLFMALLVPFDFVLFENGGGFPPYRIAFILLLAILALMLRLGNRMESHRSSSAIVCAVSVLIGVTFNWLYQYFMYFMPTQEFRAVVIIANYMVIFFTTFFAHRMRVSQIVMTSFSLLPLSYFLVAFPNIRTDTLLLIICHLSSMVVAVYFRSTFIKSLGEKYNLLMAFMPKVLAEYVTVYDQLELLNLVFKARNRYTVCLCSDWRNYQKITQNFTPEKVSQVTEDFYNRVFDSLERIDPSGHYYANWTADELFIIFYDENDDVEAINLKALRFAKELAVDIFLDMRFDTNFNLKYDIGLASGEGYLGLQGPRRFKKTTITGESAGEAKRMETEAKELRKCGGNENPNPILVLDPNLYRFLDEHNILSPAEFNRISAVTKDIEGRTFYQFQSDFFDIQKIYDVS